VLEIYRRHSEKCQRILTEKKRLPVNALRQYTECDCAIWIEGTKSNGNIVPRQSLHQRDWKIADATRRQMDTKGEAEKVHGPTLDDAIQRFLDSTKNEMKSKAHNAYKLVLGRLKDFCHQRNKLYIEDLTVDVCEDFKTYGIPKMKDTSKATYTAKLRCFLKEAERRGWVKDSLSLKVKPWKAAHEQKEPFTDKEVEAILAESAKLNGGTIGFATCAETFTLLLRLMLETGMRVSDAVRYDPRQCEKGQIGWVYSFNPRKSRKNEIAKQTAVYLNDDLKTAIEKVRWFSARLPFAYRPTAKEDETDYLGQAVYERMQEIGKRAGVDDCRPHRWRDTFAVNCLQKGMALEDVSKLLGHSSVAITERYYAKWVMKRKLRLEETFFEATKK
jgi:integrase